MRKLLALLVSTLLALSVAACSKPDSQAVSEPETAAAESPKAEPMRAPDAASAGGDDPTVVDPHRRSIEHTVGQHGADVMRQGVEGATGIGLEILAVLKHFAIVFTDGVERGGGDLHAWQGCVIGGCELKCFSVRVFQCFSF